MLLGLWLLTGVLPARGQSTTDNPDTWYVWIDITLPINGEEVRLVSAEPMVITCCVKSAKYRRFAAKAARWITANIAPDYNGELTLQKLQDQELALEMLAKAKTAGNVRQIEYQESCR